jgi:hypothetical protein
MPTNTLQGRRISVSRLVVPNRSSPRTDAVAGVSREDREPVIVNAAYAGLLARGRRRARERSAGPVESDRSATAEPVLRASRRCGCIEGPVFFAQATYRGLMRWTALQTLTPVCSNV